MRLIEYANRSEFCTSRDDRWSPRLKSRFRAAGEQSDWTSVLVRLCLDVVLFVIKFCLDRIASERMCSFYCWVLRYFVIDRWSVSLTSVRCVYNESLSGCSESDFSTIVFTIDVCVLSSHYERIVDTTPLRLHFDRSIFYSEAYMYVNLSRFGIVRWKHVYNSRFLHHSWSDGTFSWTIVEHFVLVALVGSRLAHPDLLREIVTETLSSWQPATASSSVSVWPLFTIQQLSSNCCNQLVHRRSITFDQSEPFQRHWILPTKPDSTYFGLLIFVTSLDALIHFN